MPHNRPFCPMDNDHNGHSQVTHLRADRPSQPQPPRSQGPITPRPRLRAPRANNNPNCLDTGTSNSLVASSPGPRAQRRTKPEQTRRPFLTVPVQHPDITGAGTISNCSVHPALRVSHLSPRNASNCNDHYSPKSWYQDAQTNPGQVIIFQPNNLAPQGPDPSKFGRPVRRHHQFQPQSSVSIQISTSHTRSPGQHSSSAELNTIAVTPTTPVQSFPRSGSRTAPPTVSAPRSNTQAQERIRIKADFWHHNSSIFDKGTITTTAKLQPQTRVSRRATRSRPLQPSSIQQLRTTEHGPLPIWVSCLAPTPPSTLISSIKSNLSLHHHSQCNIHASRSPTRLQLQRPLQPNQSSLSNHRTNTSPTTRFAPHFGSREHGTIRATTNTPLDYHGARPQHDSSGHSDHSGPSVKLLGPRYILRPPRFSDPPSCLAEHRPPPPRATNSVTAPRFH